MMGCDPKISTNSEKDACNPDTSTQIIIKLLEVEGR
jgi:hypothetical protein